VDVAGFDEDIIRWAYSMNMEYEKQYNFVFILDDCIHLKYLKILEKLFLVYRNSNITSICSVQYSNLIPKSIRTSAYQIIALSTDSPECMEFMIRSFLLNYLPGKNIREKMMAYADWARDYRGFYICKLTHQAYKMDSDYKCQLLQKQIIPFNERE